MKIPFRVFFFFLFSASCFASSEDPNWIQFNASFEPIISSTAAVYDLVGPGSTVGPKDSYLMGGWKFSLDYDLSPLNQIGVGFKSIIGDYNYSFKDSQGNLDELNTNAIGPSLEYRNGIDLLPHLEASAYADLGYYWLINSNFSSPVVGGSTLSGGTLGGLVALGLSFWVDPGVFGFGLDFGYQFLRFSPVSTFYGDLRNNDGSQAAVDMSGFVLVINFAEVSFDITPKPKTEHEPAPEPQPKPFSENDLNTSSQITPTIPNLGTYHSPGF